MLFHKIIRYNLPVGSRAIYCARRPLGAGGKLAERNKLRDYPQEKLPA